jgi:hypothetical protein
MHFPTMQLDVDRATNERRLFPDEIEDDDWTIYHGTSGFNTESIECHGFDASHVHITSEQVRQVVAVFKEMGWFGEDQGGFGVLNGFSLGHDLATTDKTPIFFAETSIRALLYGCRDWAGGEKNRAIRRALNDLDRYLLYPEVRKSHQETLAAYGEGNLDNVDLAWLQRKVDDLFDIRQLVHETFRRHKHGLVYALRVTQDDLKDLLFNNSMGIESVTQIPADRILSKVIVPADYQMNLSGRTADEMLHFMNSELFSAIGNSARHKAQ